MLVQVDEPALPAVLAAQVPTASGFGRHRTVHPPEASEALEWVFQAITDAGGVPVAHCCASDVPVGLLRGAGARGVSVDLGVLGPAAYDEVAEALEADQWVLLGVVPTTEPATPTDDRAASALAHRFFDMLGLDPTERTVLTPSCGLAGASYPWSRRALSITRSAARSLGAAEAQEG